MSVTLYTSLGELKLELLCEVAPRTCENFLGLCARGDYNGNVIHRNMAGFVVQMGDPTGTGKGGVTLTGDILPDEISLDLKHNEAGVVSMANNGKPNSAKSQFFISYAKQPHLDGKNTIFGRLIHGHDTLSALERVPVDSKFRPVESIVIERVTIHANPFAGHEFNSPYPHIVKHDTVVMAILDVSGYTQFTRLLMDNSSAGYNAAEYVGQTVKQCLDPIVDCILNYGGDVVKYAGDSITVIWYNNDLVNAVQSCIDATQLVQSQTFKGPDGDDIRLGLHSVVHTSSMYMIYVGTDETCDSVCFGSEYSRMCESLKYAPKGTILIMDVQDMSGFDDFGIIREIEQGVLVKVNQILNQDNLSLTARASKNRLKHIKAYRDEMKVFIDKSIIARCNQRNEIRLSEIRQVTVALAKITFTEDHSLQDEDSAVDQLSFHLQELMVMTVRSLSNHGVLRQMSVDDKGLTILMLFGLPPHVYESTVVPAGTAISQWIKELKQFPFKVNVGIATDRVFSGLIQSSDSLRKEHALLGSAVNLAARLMTQEMNDGEHIYCDSTTAKELKRFPTFEVRPLKEPLNLKGFDQLVNVFVAQPNNIEKNEILLQKSRSSFNTRTGIDFHKDNDDLNWKKRVDTWLEIGDPCTFFIEGQSGCGKTVTASRIVTYCKEKNCRIWELASYEVEALTPFHTLRSISPFLLSLFGSFDAMCQEVKLDIHQVQKTLNDLSHIFHNSGSAESSAPSSAPSQPHSIMNDIQNYQTQTVDTLVQIMNAICKKFKIVISMDDCQWQDRFSWTITHAIITRCPNILVVVISRPKKEYGDPLLKQIYESLYNLPSSFQIQVGYITLVRLEEILNGLLGNTNNSRLATALFDQTSGNAFALDVLLKYLTESGKLDGNLEPSSILPRDMTSVFVSQLDKLDSTFQKFIRTAALIGQVFDLKDVTSLCATDMINSYSQLHDWDRFEFLIQVEESRWRFRHCLIQYQIACLMTLEERKIVHRVIGDYFASLLVTNRNRKSELLPVVYQQYRLADFKQGMFNSGCKLIGHYVHFDMPYDAERIFLEIIESELFDALSVQKKLKIFAIGCRALDSTNNYDAGIRIFPKMHKLADLGYSKWTVVCIFRLLQQINKMREFWKNGKNPNVHFRQCIESEIGDRILHLWGIYDCLNNILGQKGGHANPFFLHFLFSLINVSITNQQHLSQPLWVQVCSAGCVYASMMGMKEAPLRYIKMLKADDAEKSLIVPVLFELGELTRQEIAKKCVFNSLATFVPAFNAAVHLDVKMLIKNGHEIEKIVNRLNWITMTPYSRPSFTFGCLMGGKMLQETLAQLRKLRVYLETHPTTSFSAFGFVLNMSSYYCSFMESVGPNGKVDNETSKDLSFMYNFGMEKIRGFNLVALVNHRSYLIIRHIFQEEFDQLNEQIYLLIEETSIDFYFGRSSLAVFTYGIGLVISVCLTRNDLQSTLIACEKFFRHCKKLLKNSFIRTHHTSYVVSEMWLLLLSKSKRFEQVALDASARCTDAGDLYNASMINACIYRYMKQKNAKEKGELYFALARDFYEKCGYLFSLHYLNQETKIRLCK